MTKCTWDERQQRLVPSGPANGVYETVVLPGGRTAADVSSADLARVLMAAGVEGVSAHRGRQDNLAAYAAHFQRIRQAAGDRAVREWLEGHRT